MKSTLGLIGLAVMGQNLARNFASRNIRTVVFNRTTTTAEEFIQQYGNEYLTMSKSIEEFVNSLEAPRKIFLMVQAGKAVDAVIETLLPYLEVGDIIIDGGNSHFPDTIRREKELAQKGIRFVGCGVSGGEEGALKGPSLMPGGEKEAVEELMPLFQKIAAKDFSGGACVSNMGTNGAGHYVKMVHNGIEYAVMQFLAEAYDLLKSSGKTFPKISETFSHWNEGKLASFLVELSAVITKKHDDQGDGFLLEKVLDSASQKGTGRWTIIDADERGVAVPSISAAVQARIFSENITLRKALEKQIPVLRTSPTLSEEVLASALFLAMISAYSEGFWLIQKAAEERGWKISFSEISRIWQGGCIIRAQILKFLEDTFRKQSENKPLLLLPEILEEITSSLPQLRTVVAEAVRCGIPVPGFSASLEHLEQVIRGRGSANFLQGLRDAFGAHTFRRIDQEGVFHVEWE